MEIFLIIIICILCALCVFLGIKRKKEDLDYSEYIKESKQNAAISLADAKKAREANDKMKEILQQTQQEVEAAKKSKEFYKDELNKANLELIKVKGDISNSKTKLENNEKRIEDINKQYEEKQLYIQDAEKSADKIFQERFKALENTYIAKEKEYKENMQELSNLLQEEIDNIQIELLTIKTTRDAALEAWRKEEEIKANKDFYRLDITIDEQNDITLLNSIKPRFSNPRVISKLIWQAYYQPLTKIKFPKILGEAKTGIYKITNIKNDMCYIGQAKDLRKRFLEHCRNGCGIDTPSNNKLYKAMLEDGLDNFTFEVIDECDIDSLNTKEAYFIDLYSAVDYGYNSRNESR